MTAVADYVAERSPESPAPEPQSPNEAAWSPATRIAFRFCFLYFGLYVLMTQMLAGMLPIPKFRLPVLGEKPPMRPLVLWVGNNLLGVQPTVHPTGSGDTLFDWTHAFTLLLLAVLWADKLNDIPKALEAARGARKLSPNDPVIAGTLGRISYRANDYAAPLALLKEYARPDNPGAYNLYDLALAH